MDIAKITNEEEFQKVLAAYLPLVDNPKALVSERKELKTKIESFMKKHLVQLNKHALKDVAKLDTLLEFLCLIDKELPYRDFFASHGLELFPIVFKLTFYSNDFAVINHNHHGSGYLALSIEVHDQVLDKITKAKDSESKCNYVVNNLLVKMLLSLDRQQLLGQVAQLMFDQEKLISIKKLSKLLVFFGKLFEVAVEKRSKYLQGSLFALGGLLKIEAKSYLQTLSERKAGFKPVCPITDPDSDLDKQEERRIRIMSDEDLEYFENDFHQVVSEFIRSLVAPVKGQISLSNFNYYQDVTNAKFIDEYEEHEQANPEKLYSIEGAHFTLCFIFDMLQFVFQHMVMVEEVTKSEPSQQLGDQSQKRDFFDHRKPIDPEKDLVFFKFKYYLDNFDQILRELVSGATAICPTPINLLWLWHIKNAESTSKLDDSDDTKDSYERTDNYNPFGFGVFNFLQFKYMTAHLTKNEQLLQGKAMDYCLVNQYSAPVSTEFMFESIMPFLGVTLKSKSHTLKSIGLETVGLWSYLTQGKQCYDALGHFSKDELSSQFMMQGVFTFMGGQELSTRQKNLSMKVVKRVLDLFTPKPRIQILNFLLVIMNDEKNDRALSVLISYFFKDYCDKEDPQLFLEYAKDVFAMTLNVLKDDSQFILDFTERLQASLNLYSFLVRREKSLIVNGQLKEPVISDKSYKSQIRKELFEPLIHTIQAGFDTIEQDRQKVEGQDKAIRDGMITELERRDNALRLIQGLLSEANSY